MPNADHVEQFIRLFFAGVGLFLVAALNLLMSRARVRSRVVASVAVGTLVLAGYAAWDATAASLGRVATVIGIGLLPVLLLGSRRVVEFGAAVLRVAHKPAARWGALAGVAVVVVAAAGVDFARKDDRALEQEMSELDALMAQPDLAAIDYVAAKTDRGAEVVMRRPRVLRESAAINDPEGRALRQLGYDHALIRCAPATDFTNCHGWVFTGGQYWVGGDSVQQILDDNGYTATTTPNAGDIVIYRKDGTVTHTGLVRYTGGDGTPPMVESKWSWMGAFLHPVDKSVYGSDYTFYRSPRDGHVLAGLTQPAN